MASARRGLIPMIPSGEESERTRQVIEDAREALARPANAAFLRRHPEGQALLALYGLDDLLAQEEEEEEEARK